MYVQIRQFRDEGQISFNSCNDQFVVKCLGLSPTTAVQDVSTMKFMSQKAPTKIQILVTHITGSGHIEQMCL